MNIVHWFLKKTWITETSLNNGLFLPKTCMYTSLHYPVVMDLWKLSRIYYKSSCVLGPALMKRTMFNLNFFFLLFIRSVGILYYSWNMSFFSNLQSCWQMDAWNINLLLAHIPGIFPSLNPIICLFRSSHFAPLFYIYCHLFLNCS